MRIPDPKANTTTEAYLAYKAGYLEESELKPKLYEPYLHFDAWLAYWAGLTNTYPLDKNGDPEMLTDEEALVAYLSGVTDTYPEEIKDPYDVRIVGYLKHLASIRWPEPDYPVNNEEFYLSTMEPTHTSNSVPSSDIELDTAEGKIIDVEAYGDTTQTTYSGKNLANYLDAVQATAETTLTFVNDGFRQVTTATGFGTKLQLTGLDSSTTYTLSCNLAVTSGTTNKVIRIFEGTTQSVTYAVLSPAMTGANSLTFTTGASATSVNIWFYNGIPGAGDTTWTKIMLEKGSAVTDYEPYVGGTPAPNPDYPQPISVVTGENTVKVVGKNLFHFTESRTVTAGGVTFETTEGTSVLKINGTSTSSGNFSTNLIRDASPLTLEAGTYTIKIDGFNRITASTDYAYLGKVGIGAYVYLNPNNNWQATFTLNEKTSLYMQGIFAPSTAYDNKDVTIQLELGSAATSYQAYTAQDYTISLTGKNLFNKATSTAGYRIDTNGDPYANASYFISDYIVVQPSTTYAYSRGAAGSGLSTIAYYKSDKTFISRTMPTIGSSDTSGTVTTPNNAYYARFCDLNEVLDSAQLELGATATEYEAYSSIELAKIGAYQDRIYKDDGKWYIEKNVGKTTLDGSEEYIWNYNSGTYSGFYRAVDTVLTDGMAKVNDARLSRSNNFTCESTTTTWTGAGKFGFSSTWTMWFEMMDNTLTNYRDFNAWLSTHPTTIYYPLATPTTTEITNSELISQLDALAGADTYNVKTYIKVTATEHNLPALLKVEAYKY